MHNTEDSNQDTDYSLFEQLFEQSDIGLIIVNKDLRVVTWNHWMTVHSGPAVEDIRGERLMKVFPVLQNSSLQRGLLAAKNNAMSSVISHTLNRKPLPLLSLSGQVIHQHIIVKPIELSGCEAAAFIQISDVSSAVNRERQIQYQAKKAEALAEKLAQTLNIEGVRRLMDLGGGSGVISLALLRHHPDLTAVVVDIANVCHAGREIAAETPMARRITYHPADFLQDSLPTGFDIILECDVGIYTEELFRKLHASLNRGGHLVIVDWLIQPDRQQSFWRLSHAFISSLGTSEFTNQTSEEVQKLLAQVGFHPISAKTLENNAVIIQADKRS